MHILVDIRTESPLDLIRLEYGRAWAKLWKEYHPHDILTFLVTEWVHIEEESVIFVKKDRGFFTRRKIAHHEHGPDRIVSFSVFDPIDTHIPTITHVFDSALVLYPRSEMNILERKLLERRFLRTMQHSHDIIVPHIEIGMELVEVFGIPEKKISVIPYFLPERVHHPFAHLHLYGVTAWYWITEWSRGDEWNPFTLLQVYARYIHEFNGTKRLIITGDLGDNMRHISECIRGLGILDYVKIIGILPPADRACLYEYASGWISVGSYYSAWPSITMALSYWLPTLVADIAPIRDFSDLTIHPNHTNELIDKLLIFTKLSVSSEKYTESQHSVVEVYGRVIAESTCKRYKVL